MAEHLGEPPLTEEEIALEVAKRALGIKGPRSYNYHCGICLTNWGRRGVFETSYISRCGRCLSFTMPTGETGWDATTAL